MEVAELREALGPGQPEFRARQVYHALYQQRIGELAKISTLPAPLRARLAESHTVGLPALAQRYDLQPIPDLVGSGLAQVLDRHAADTR